MKKRNLWLRMSAYTLAATLTVTSFTPVYAADKGTKAQVQSEVSVQADEEAAGTSFGTADTKLEKGTYTVPASLKNASNLDNDSMAASCIAGDATLVVAEDGSAKVTVPITSVTVGSVTSGSTDWKIYKGDTTTEATDAEFTIDEEGNVNSITFTIPDNSKDGVYVQMTIAKMGSSAQAFLKIDYTKAQAVAQSVDTTALEESIAKADTLEENAYTKATWDANKDAIDAANTAAKAALEEKESQEAVDAANKTLTDAMAKLAEAGDQTAIKEALAAAKALNENDYTVKSWNSLKNYITKAETQIANRDTARNLKKTTSWLNSYMEKLVPKYSTEALEKLIAEAEALNQEEYTKDSWKEADITGAVNKAKTAIDSRGDKDAVHMAINNLETAMDKLVNVSTAVTVGRGSFQKKLAPGTYSLPLELLNGGHAEATNQYTSGDYMSHTSMAAGCFTGDATLVIHEDGTATVTVGVQAITAMGMTGAASDWTIYDDTQDYLDGKANSSTGARYKARVDKTKVQAGKKKPSQISFAIPDLKQNVVATNMYIEVMSVYQDACIGLDWLHVEKTSDATTATSDVEKDYVVKADTLTQLKNLKAGKTVQLDEDFTLTGDLTIKGGTLDLNGHTLNQADNLIMIKGDVNVIDSSAEKTGKIKADKYFASTQSTTSISVQKGSFTADGVTIDGQIGNRIFGNGTMSMEENPRVAVKLTNCTLVNNMNVGSTSTGAAENVSFTYLKNGVDVAIDNCTTDKGICVAYGNDEKTSIANSTIGGKLYVAGSSAVVTNVTTTDNPTFGASAVIGADDCVVKDDNFTSLEMGNGKDAVLENVNVKTTSKRASAALYATGSGQVTVENGVFENTEGYAVKAISAPVSIEGGYFKGSTGTVDGAYVTPAGKILGDVTEGEYAGYQTLVDGQLPEVADPAATIYNADGSVARKISKDDAALALTYATAGQTVQLNEDLNVDTLNYYKDCTLDLNGHVITEESGVTGNAGTCRVIDSSKEKSGKIVGTYYIANLGPTATMVLDNVSVEALFVQGISTGKLYITNGTKVINAAMFNAVMGGGTTYIQDSVITIAEKDGTGSDITDPQGVIENNTRTSQYTITKTGDRTFTVAANELGKAMRAFEEIDASAYTKASYAAAKAVYTEVDESADEDIQGDVIAQKAKELNDAVAALQKPASETAVKELKDALAAAKKLAAADYTSDSYKTFSSAVSAADKVLKAEEASETEVTNAAKTLANAKAKLVKMKSQSITGVSSAYSKKFGDKAFTLKAKAAASVSYKSDNTKVATVDKNGKVTIKGAGIAKITITAAANSQYKKASKVVTIKVAKAAPTIKVKVAAKTIKYKTVKKKAQVFSLGASVNSKGKLSFKKASKSSVLSVNSKGKISVKKAVKKGSYKLKVKVSAAAKGNYKAGSKTVNVTVKVK